MIDSPILQEAAAYYASKLDAHGATPQGVDWNGTDSHEQRHRQFLRLLDGNSDASIIDLGCGFGDFLRFLRTVGHRGRFIGYDICLLYTSDAADDLLCVDLGGRR